MTNKTEIRYSYSYLLIKVPHTFSFTKDMGSYEVELHRYLFGERIKLT